METVPLVYVATLLAVSVVCSVAFLQLAHRHCRLLLMLRQRSGARPLPKTAVGVFIESWRTFVGPRLRRGRPQSASQSSGEFPAT